MQKDEPMNRFVRKISSSRFEPANGPATLVFKAIYANEVKAKEVAITIKEIIPDPVFTLEAPAAWDGRRVFVHFGGVQSAFYVWVNGARVYEARVVRGDVTFEALSKMKAVFKKDGLVTPGNASGLNDGDAA